MEPAIRSSCSTAVEREFCAIGKPMELINHIIDQRAHQSPELLYAEIPLSSTRFEDGFRKATYSAFANAINGVAWWLSEQLGVGKQFKTLVYLGPNDLRHNILLFGAVKAGYKVGTQSKISINLHIGFLMLNRCPDAVHLTPLQHSSSSKPNQVSRLRYFACTSTKAFSHRCHPRGLRVAGATGPYGRRVVRTTLSQLSIPQNFEDARHEPLVVLHTSGTTGLPKPIIWTHDWAASFGRERRLPPPPGFNSSDRLLYGNRILSLMPPFHMSGLGIECLHYCSGH